MQNPDAVNMLDNDKTIKNWKTCCHGNSLLGDHDLNIELYNGIKIVSHFTFSSKHLTITKPNDPIDIELTENTGSTNLSSLFGTPETPTKYKSTSTSQEDPNIQFRSAVNELSDSIKKVLAMRGSALCSEITNIQSAQHKLDVRAVSNDGNFTQVNSCPMS